jgi:hypothetical protein
VEGDHTLQPRLETAGGVRHQPVQRSHAILLARSALNLGTRGSLTANGWGARQTAAPRGLANSAPDAHPAATCAAVSNLVISSPVVSCAERDGGTVEDVGLVGSNTVNGERAA